MSRAADAPSSRIRRVLIGGCGVIERANGHLALLDGRYGDDTHCGVVFINSSHAFYGKRLMPNGWVRRVLKEALHNGGSFEDDDSRDVWPSRYQTVDLENAKVMGA